MFLVWWLLRKRLQHEMVSYTDIDISVFNELTEITWSYSYRWNKTKGPPTDHHGLFGINQVSVPMRSRYEIISQQMNKSIWQIQINYVPFVFDLPYMYIDFKYSYFVVCLITCFNCSQSSFNFVAHFSNDFWRWTNQSNTSINTCFGKIWSFW